ncbi:hypothetical protein KBB27_03820 [Patescibacteria group bacterium]|nr:hypothetical protein [Patescibacteria group bacterium]
MSTRQPEGLSARLDTALLNIENHRESNTTSGNDVYAIAIRRIVQELENFQASDIWNKALTLLDLTNRRIVLGLQFMPHGSRNGVSETEQSTCVVALALTGAGFCTIANFGTHHSNQGNTELISLEEFASCLLACSPLLDIEDPLAELYQQLDRLAGVINVK